MKMLLTALVVVMFAGCGGFDSIEHNGPDAGVDAGTGSGSDMAMTIEPSPQDGNLDVIVIGASIIVAVLPVGLLRRRRRIDEVDSDDAQFS
jgi:hypothetical protein